LEFVEAAPAGLVPALSTTRVVLLGGALRLGAHGHAEQGNDDDKSEWLDHASILIVQIVTNALLGEHCKRRRGLARTSGHVYRDLPQRLI
jgi:hypothetical protein